jgi:hypothetical protein
MMIVLTGDSRRETPIASRRTASSYVVGFLTRGHISLSLWFKTPRQSFISRYFLVGTVMYRTY